MVKDGVEVHKATPVVLTSPISSGTLAGGRFTRVKKAWLLSKMLELKFEGRDFEAICDLDEVLREVHTS